VLYSEESEAENGTRPSESEVKMVEDASCCTKTFTTTTNHSYVQMELDFLAIL
jgi:hypothetical protein